MGRKVNPFRLCGEFKLDPEAFVRHVRKTGSNAAVLIRPNNPTGSLISKSDLAFLLEDLRDLDLVLVDDSFIEFVTTGIGPSSVELGIRISELGRAEEPVQELRNPGASFRVCCLREQ